MGTDRSPMSGPKRAGAACPARAFGLRSIGACGCAPIGCLGDGMILVGEDVMLCELYLERTCLFAAPWGPCEGSGC